jgi:hypothetical protein
VGAEIAFSSIAFQRRSDGSDRTETISFNPEVYMRVHNGNALDLSGPQGEQITVTVAETTGKPLLVSYDRNDVKTGSLDPSKSSDSFDFQLDRNERDPTRLTMLFTFTGSDDFYDIVVQGDQGGDTSQFAVAQNFNVPGDSITYTFDIT